jgi:hypothetical protein
MNSKEQEFRVPKTLTPKGTLDLCGQTLQLVFITYSQTA